MPDDDALVAWLRDLVEVETPSGDIEALDEAFAVLGAQVEGAFGRRPIISRVNGTPYLYVPAVAQPSVLVLGHLDTVWPRGTLAEIPFTVIDDVARGPGVLDMKAGLVIANAAAAHCEIPDHIGLLVTGDEEIGSPIGRGLVESHAPGHLAVFVPEAAAPGGAVKIARKGVSIYQLAINGREAHAGLEPERGLNATVEMGALIGDLVALQDADLGTTVTPTKARSGVTGNTIPSDALLHVDVRAWSQEELEARIRKSFVESDPLSDLAFPILAMTRAKKVDRLLLEAYGETDLADLVIPFFAVSTNLTSGRIEVHRRGLMRRAMRASIAIPGLLPPIVIDGQVLVDGAVLKNLPTEVMRQMHSGPIIGVDMSEARGVDPDLIEHPPSIWRLIVTGAWRRGPPIVSILMRSATLTTDADIESSRAATDLLIQPTPDRLDIRDWKGFNVGVAAGYLAASEALARLDGPVTGLRRRHPGADLAPSPDDLEA
jgi:predicted acylesterase/phospholipase RssA